MWRSPSIGDSSINRNLWLFWPITLSIICGNGSFNDSDKLWRVPQSIIPLSRSDFWLLLLVFKNVWNCQDHMRCFSKDWKPLDCHFCRPHEALSRRQLCRDYLSFTRTCQKASNLRYTVLFLINCKLRYDSILILSLQLIFKIFFNLKIC
jgi:hypothetical protein